jgi:hypothetical protein
MMRLAGLLPDGDIPMPNEQLQEEWFHMTFHKSDHAEYVQSGCKLSNKMLQTIVEYFQSIHEAHENDGNLMRHQIRKIRVEAKHELHRKLEERYVHKKCLLSNQCRATGCTINTMAATIFVSMADRSSASSATTAVAVTTNATTGRVPLSTKTRTSSPVASTASMPSTRTKSAMLMRNQEKLHANNNKCRHKSGHYNDNPYTSSNNELRRSAHIPMPSNSDASASNKSESEENFYLIEGKKNKKRRSGNVLSSPCSCKSGGTSRIVEI